MVGEGTRGGRERRREGGSKVMAVAYPGGFMVARKPPPRPRFFLNQGVRHLLAPIFTSHLHL